MSRRRHSKARLKALKRKKYGCEICGSFKQLEGHHVYKFAVFQELNCYDKIVWLCHDCHTNLEELIRTRENDVLRNKPELYEKAFEQFKEMKRNGILQSSKMGSKVEAYE